MSATGSTKSSDGLPEWDGNENTYSRHKRKITGHKRTHKKNYMDGKFFTMPDPRNRDRETRRRRATENDPTGTKQGAWVEAESEEEYENLCDEYTECLADWFHVLGASLVGGKAEEKAEEMLASDTLDGKRLELELDRIYEKKSNKNMAGLFLDWITTEKPHDVPTEEWTPKWNNTRKIINKNMDWPTMQSYIYMKLLGPTNNQFYKIETSKTTLPDLAELQSKAEDWDRDNRREGEGKHPSHIALMAQQTQTSTQTRGTGRAASSNLPYNDSNHPDWLTVPCVACPHRNKSKNFHCMRDCFDGGLSHLTDDEKDAWLMMKRQAKEKRHNRNANGSNNNRTWQKRKRGGGYDNEQADLAEEVTALRRKLKQREQTDVGLSKIAEKAREHGLESEFDPLVDETRGVFYLSQK